LREFVVVCAQGVLGNQGLHVGVDYRHDRSPKVDQISST